MSIRRAHLAFEEKFVQVPNEWIRDSRISRKARGLLVEIMSHSPGWIVTLDSLVDAGIEGRDSLRTAIKELEKHGYLTRERERNSDGTLAGVDYVITDPWEAEPTSDNPTLADPPHKKTIPSEDQSQEQDSTSSGSVLSQRGTDTTDSEVLSAVIMRQVTQYGLTEQGLRDIRVEIEARTNRRLTLIETLRVAQWIIVKKRTPPRVPGRYVLAAIGLSAAEVQQYIDEQAMGS